MFADKLVGDRNDVYVPCSSVFLKTCQHLPPHTLTIANLRQEGYVFIGVCLFVCLSVCLLICRITPKLFLTDFHKIRWKGNTWATEETVRFGWFFEPRYVRVRVMVRVTVSWGAAILRMGGHFYSVSVYR